MVKKKTLLVIGFCLIAGVLVIRQQRSNAPEMPAPSQTEAGFDKSQHAIDQPGSLWWIVNKQRPLPKGYAPGDLATPDIPIRPNAGSDERQVSKKIIADLEAMVAAAEQAGLNLLLASGYRSYDLQVSVYNQNVRQLGQEGADKVSARPGTSEHQTGLAIDIGRTSNTCALDACFATIPAGKWIAAHAHEYGFIIRYPEGKQPVTGYEYEPWHLRYVGRALAAELKRTGAQTLEEFFDL